jgi:hypothetical protein
MKQNILFAIAFFTLSFTVTIAADPQEEPISDSAPTTALVEKINGLSPKKAKRPNPLNFSADFGSTQNPQDALSEKIKHSVVQLSLKGKEIALKIFTYENMNAVKVFIISATITCFWAAGEFIKWVFNRLNSLRITFAAPKLTEKTS